MVELKNELAGYFTISKGSNPDDMQEICTFPNLITDAGLLRFASGNFLDYCHIGASSVAPSVSDTTLVSKLYHSSTLLSANTGANNTDPDNRFVWKRVTMRFEPKGVSYNVAEVGFGWDTTNVFNRATIKDGNGLPTTISVLDNEYFDITYELRLYPPKDDTTGTVVPTGKDTTPRTWTARSSGESGNISYSVNAGWGVEGYVGYLAYMSWVFCSTDSISPVYNQITNGGYAYPDSYTRTPNPTLPEVTLSYTFGLSSGNFDNGISSFVVRGYSCNYQVGFSAPFMKTNTDQITFTVKISWGRRP